MERLIREVLKEQYRRLLTPEVAEPAAKPPEIAKPEAPEIVKPKVKPPEIPSVFFEPGTSRSLSARRNRIFGFRKCKGTLFYFIMRTESSDYKVYLTVDNKSMITGETYSELVPDSSRIDWYMAYYDHSQEEYVFGLFKIMWSDHFILIIEPSTHITANIKYSGVKI